MNRANYFDRLNDLQINHSLEQSLEYESEITGQPLHQISNQLTIEESSGHSQPNTVELDKIYDKLNSLENRMSELNSNVSRLLESMASPSRLRGPISNPSPTSMASNWTNPTSPTGFTESTSPVIIAPAESGTPIIGPTGPTGHIVLEEPNHTSPISHINPNPGTNNLESLISSLPHDNRQLSTRPDIMLITELDYYRDLYDITSDTRERLRLPLTKEESDRLSNVNRLLGSFYANLDSNHEQSNLLERLMNAREIIRYKTQGFSLDCVNEIIESKVETSEEEEEENEDEEEPIKPQPATIEVMEDDEVTL